MIGTRPRAGGLWWYLICTSPIHVFDLIILAQ